MGLKKFLFVGTRKTILEQIKPILEAEKSFFREQRSYSEAEILHLGARNSLWRRKAVLVVKKKTTHFGDKKILLVFKNLLLGSESLFWGRKSPF